MIWLIHCHEIRFKGGVVRKLTSHFVLNLVCMHINAYMELYISYTCAFYHDSAACHDRHVTSVTYL